MLSELATSAAASPASFGEALSADGAGELPPVAVLLARVDGFGMGDGVSAEACPGIMTTTMAHAAIDRLMPLKARRRIDRRCFTRVPQDLFPKRVLCPERRNDQAPGTVLVHVSDEMPLWVTNSC